MVEVIEEEGGWEEESSSSVKRTLQGEILGWF